MHAKSRQFKALCYSIPKGALLSMLNATVVKRQDVTEELVILHVKPDAGVTEFLPGQYLALGLYGSAPRPEGFPAEKEEQKPDKIIKRAYSIGSSPLQKDAIEFYIAVVPDGALTSRLALVKEGDRVFAAPKITGTFTIDHVPENENLILVSTGTGLAPYMSMIRTPSTWTEGRSITVIHGVRYAKDLAYREELLTLEKERSNFSYLPIVSRADPEWSGNRGHIQSLFEAQKASSNPATDHVFLCGNPAMVNDMEARLIAQGYEVHSKKVPNGKLHLEKYW
jgi:ferredoxin/flavodoxin---NADP+ reductase